MVQHPSITLDLANTGGIEVVELSQLRGLNRRGIATTRAFARSNFSVPDKLEQISRLAEEEAAVP